MSPHRILPFLIVVLAGATFTLSSASTLDVPGDFADLQDALNAAADGDTILVSAGTYTRDLQQPPVESLRTRYIVPVPVVLAGATGNPADVVLDGQGHGRVVTCLAGLNGLVVRDLTIANGNTSFYGPTDGAGAGLASWGGDRVVDNCVFRENVTGWKNAGGGAGMYLEGGTALVTGCLFRDNRAIEGGSGDSGALKMAGIVGEVVDCVFEGNLAASAGAMAVAFGPGDTTSDVTIRLCRFEGNTATGFGGGATVWQWCTARFEKCLFLNNVAENHSGGALRVGDADVTVQSCRFEGNTAGTEGGAIYAAYWTGPTATLDLLDCTLVDNTAGTSGGAIHLLADATLFGWNTDFAGNSAPAGVDGSVAPGGDATLACCLTSPDMWAGTIALDNSECTVATEKVTWGEVKAIFR